MGTHLAVAAQRPLTLGPVPNILERSNPMSHLPSWTVLSMRLIHNSSGSFACFFLSPLLWDLIPHKSWKDKDVTFLPSQVAHIHRLSDRVQQPLGECISV